MKRCLWVLCLFCGFLAWPVWAHKASDSYLSLNAEGDRIVGQWDIALRDLEFALGLDANGDGQITWGELRARHNDIASYALSRLRISEGERNCPLRVRAHLVDHHTDGAYEVLRFEAACPGEIQALTIQYGLLFDVDPQHKGLLNLVGDKTSQTAIFSPEKTSASFSVREPALWGQFVDYLKNGIWHIWIGFDHVLFLISLLLPAVLLKKPSGWYAVESFRPAFWDVFKIVTSFTVRPFSRRNQASVK